jgi:hypothetical protein
VAIANSSPGPIVLVAHTTLPGVEVHIDHAQVEAGGHAVITIHAGNSTASGSVEVAVQPTGQIIAIKTTVE